MITFFAFKSRILFVLFLGIVGPPLSCTATWRGLPPSSNIPLPNSLSGEGGQQRSNEPLPNYNHQNRNNNNGNVNNQRSPSPRPQSLDQRPQEGPIPAATSNNGVLAGLLRTVGSLPRSREEPRAAGSPVPIETPQASTFLYRDQNFTEEMFLLYSPEEKAVYQITKVSVTPQGALKTQAPPTFQPRPQFNPSVPPNPKPSRLFNGYQEERRPPPPRPTNERRPPPFRPLFDDDDRRPPQSTRPLPFDIIDTRGRQQTTQAPFQRNNNRRPPVNPGFNNPRDVQARPPKKYFQVRLIVEGRK